MRNHHFKSRGTAMAETILALPFLMLILLFLVYFGRNSVRVERTHMMDRYEAWREAGHGPGPRPDDPRGHPQMNDTWFNNNATTITHTGSSDFPDDAPQDWINEASQRTTEAGDLAREMHDALPRGRTAQFSSQHDTTNVLLQQFNGPVNAIHTVQGNDWKYINGYKHRASEYEADQKAGPYVHTLSPLRDLFYQDFDRTLEGMSDAQNPLAKTMRGLYLDIPGYRGPKVQ